MIFGGLTREMSDCLRSVTVIVRSTEWEGRLRKEKVISEVRVVVRVGLFTSYEMVKKG